AGFGFYFTRSKVAFTGVSTGKAQALELRFRRASRNSTIEPAERLAGRVNYLHGKDPAGWQPGLPTYGQLTYRNLWPGIDMVFHGSGGSLRYEFLVRPGSNVSSIRLRYAGARRLSLTSGGALLVHTAFRSLLDHPPRSFQLVDRRKVPVRSSFALGRGTRSYGFKVGRYDRS